MYIYACIHIHVHVYIYIYYTIYVYIYIYCIYVCVYSLKYLQSILYYNNLNCFLVFILYKGNYHCNYNSYIYVVYRVNIFFYSYCIDTRTVYSTITDVTRFF